MQMIRDTDNRTVLTFELFGITFEIGKGYASCWYTSTVKELFYIGQR